MVRPLVVLLLTTAAFAGSHAPLPPALMDAKTVYIDNQSGAANLADRCYDELKKWNRFVIVADPKKADVIFRIGAHVDTHGATAHTSPDYSGGSNTTISDNRVGVTRIDIVQSGTGQLLWSDSRNWGSLFTGFRSATRAVVNELRKRIEEQEKAP